MDSRGRVLDIQSSGKVVYVKDSCDIVTVGSTMPAIGEELGGIVECPSSTIDTAEPYTGSVVVPADGQWAETLLEFDNGIPAEALEQYRDDHDVWSWVGWQFDYDQDIIVFKDYVDNNGKGVAIFNGLVVVVVKTSGVYNAYIVGDGSANAYRFRYAIGSRQGDINYVDLIDLSVEAIDQSEIIDIIDYMSPVFGEGIATMAVEDGWYTFPVWCTEI